MSRSLLAFATTICIASPAVQAAPGSAATREVDALLAPWAQPGKPGAAVAVIKDGSVVYRRGVGLADIQHKAPITPATPFHIASISKQFTAFAIHLLAQDGKLTLDDDVRKHIPELHDFGATITLRQLIHHTSGLRDQWNLLALGGWRLEDVITEDDILRVVTGQRALNAPPGQEHNYSNTGYTLLGVVVKRVSGMSLAEFSQQRIFTPLGMRNTRFVDDYQRLIPGRAASYAPNAQGGWDYVALSYSNNGATSLSTTVDDLGLWDRNFYDGEVGGRKLLDAMQTVGELTGGRKIGYASGLVRGKYRGLDTVEHGGGDAGYRSDLLRVPSERFSVIVLSNAGNFDAGGMSRKIAAIFLKDKLTPASAAPAAPAKPAAPVEVALDPARLDAYVGNWILDPNFSFIISKEDGKLFAQPTGQSRYPLFASSERSFFLKVVDGDFTFDPPGSDGVVASAVYRQDARRHPIVRNTLRVPSGAELTAYEGEYYSHELRVLYRVSQKDGKLVVRYPRGDVILQPSGKHGFEAGWPLGRVDFQCAQADCRTFTLDNGRVRGLQFTKVLVATVAPGGHSVAFEAPPVIANPVAYGDEPMYLRGSMNGWGMRNPLRQVGSDRYEATVALDTGKHEFKIGSLDFRSVDLGAVPKEETVRDEAPRRIKRFGGNIVLEVAQPASYVFSLDTSNPARPMLSVKPAP